MGENIIKSAFGVRKTHNALPLDFCVSSTRSRQHLWGLLLLTVATRSISSSIWFTPKKTNPDEKTNSTTKTANQPTGYTNYMKNDAKKNHIRAAFSWIEMDEFRTIRMKAILHKRICWIQTRLYHQIISVSIFPFSLAIIPFFFGLTGFLRSISIVTSKIEGEKMCRT